MAEGPRLKPLIAVAGHVCLDVFPTFEQRASTTPEFAPGSLIHVGPVLQSPGGAVANTGLALHRLGLPVRLIGKIGDDLFGREVIRLFREAGPTLADHMVVVPGEHPSYSIVLSPPGRDRLFLHRPGTNGTYAAEDIDPTALENVGLFHFGYPSIMRRMYADGGNELVMLLRRVRDREPMISLDTCSVDPSSDAGRVDWDALLRNVLPHVDFFVPSYDEIAFMLRMETPRADEPPDVSQLTAIGERLLAYGAAVVVLKLGPHGLYLRSTDDRSRLKQLHLDKSWLGRELYAPCFQADVIGTTGSGDCTIAGLLAALMHGEDPERAATSATAVGACSVEAMDACSGIQPWPKVKQRLRDGWRRHQPRLRLDDWRSADSGIYLGPNDTLAGKVSR